MSLAPRPRGLSSAARVPRWAAGGPPHEAAAPRVKARRSRLFRSRLCRSRLFRSRRRRSGLRQTGLLRRGRPRSQPRQPASVLPPPRWRREVVRCRGPSRSLHGRICHLRSEWMTRRSHTSLQRSNQCRSRGEEVERRSVASPVPVHPSPVERAQLGALAVPRLATARIPRRGSPLRPG